MKVLPLLLTASLLRGVLCDLTLHLNTSIYVSQSTPWLYYTISPTVLSQPFSLLELRLETDNAAALLAARNKGPPLYIAASDYLLADEVDYEGWFSAKKQQYLKLSREMMRKGTIVGVFFNQSASEGSNLAYQISLWEEQRCPFDCSANGLCTSSTDCQCHINYTATDCSLPNHRISELSPINVTLTSSEWAYFSINMSDCNLHSVSSSALIVHLNWSQGSLEVLTKSGSSNISPLPSPFEYTSKHSASTAPMSIRLNEDEALVWKLAIRLLAGYDRVEVRIVVSRDRSYLQDRIRWGLITCGVVAFVMILGLGICKYWRYRRRKLAFNYANQKSTLSGMPNSLVDIHFPVHLFEETESTQRACPICLDSFQPESLTRQLACAHQFHSACITTWFQTSTNCCVCHRDYASLTESAEESVSVKGKLSDEDIRVDFSRQSETATQNETQAAELFSFRP